ncbi:MAG: histidine kinase N-terminal 7TM domain-containing protein [Treponemataceae bacterium]
MRFSVVITFLGLLSCGLSLSLFVYASRRHNSAPGIVPFSLLMLANAIYAAAYTIELNTLDLSSAVFWLKVEHLGVTMIPVFWVLFANAFVDKTPKHSGHLALSLSVLPIITIVLAFTNDFHHLLYTGFRLDPELDLTVIIASRGPWYWINAVYLYSLLFLGTTRIILRIFGSSKAFRTQSIVIVAGVLFPWFAHAVLIIRKGPYNLDPTPFALSVSGVLLVFGIYKFRLFDLIPIARERVVEAIRDGVIILDTKSRFVDANIAAKNVFGWLNTMNPGDDAAALFDTIPLKNSDHQSPTDLSLLLNGSIRHFRVDTTDIGNGRGESVGTAIIIADTTETTELLEKLAKLATTDDLTGANNRRRFFELADREMELARRKERPISFAMFDLDHFKAVNDKYGHPAGDAALKAVCDACRSVLRSSDILCRYGGEEFVILFAEASPEAAAEIAERLRLKIEKSTIYFDSVSFNVTASFGIAGSENGPKETLNDYLKKIDIAMYQAKEAGRNRIQISAPKPVS